MQEGKIERGNKNYETREWGKRRIQRENVGTYSLLSVCSNIGVSPEGRRKRLSLFVQGSTPSLSGEEFRNWTRGRREKMSEGGELKTLLTNRETREPGTSDGTGLRRRRGMGQNERR